MHTHRARRRCYATLNPKPRLWRSAVVHICVLAAVFSRRAASIIHPSRDLSVLQYVFRGWRMLLINLLLTSLQHHALESSTWSRMALSLALVLAIDLLGLASRSWFQDVRGYGRKYGNPFFHFDFRKGLGPPTTSSECIERQCLFFSRHRGHGQAPYWANQRAPWPKGRPGTPRCNPRSRMIASFLIPLPLPSSSLLRPPKSQRSRKSPRACTRLLSWK